MFHLLRKKCKYYLKTYITQEIQLNLCEINSIKLSKHNSIHYFHKIKNDEHIQINIRI